MKLRINHSDITVNRMWRRRWVIKRYAYFDSYVKVGMFEDVLLAHYALINIKKVIPIIFVAILETSIKEQIFCCSSL